MKKESKLRIASVALTASILINGFALTKPANAETKYQRGTFITENVNEENNYFGYVVKKNDSLSTVSKKICKYLGIESTTKYWPVLAYLNNVKTTVIVPGDILVFPTTIEELESLLENLKESGWTNNYIKKNHIYKNKKRRTVRSLVEEIYGSSDDDFVELFLQIQGLESTYDIDSVIEAGDTEMLFDLTEWLPTMDELTEYDQKDRPKQKRYHYCGE